MPDLGTKHQVYLLEVPAVVIILKHRILFSCVRPWIMFPLSQLHCLPLPSGFYVLIFFSLPAFSALQCMGLHSLELNQFLPSWKTFPLICHLLFSCYICWLYGPHTHAFISHFLCIPVVWYFHHSPVDCLFLALILLKCSPLQASAVEQYSLLENLLQYPQSPPTSLCLFFFREFFNPTSQYSLYSNI